MGGMSMSAEEALHFGLIPRMHRGIFAINELLTHSWSRSASSTLEERDGANPGYPIRFDIDVLILFSANPATYNRSGQGHPAAQGPHRSVIHTHYRWSATRGSRSWTRKSRDRFCGDWPVVVPYS